MSEISATEIATSHAATVYGIHPATWLWQHLIPLGKITLLAGDPGLGKSFISLDLAARLSRGFPMPPTPPLNPNLNLSPTPSPIESPTPKPQTRRRHNFTLLLSAEDGLQDTIYPRIIAQSGNPDFLLPLRCLDARAAEALPFSFKSKDHLKTLEALLEKSHAKLLIIDPITAFMDGIDQNSTSQVRLHLTPLAQLALRHNIAVLAITHLSKRTQHHSLYRATGSLALAAIARSVLLVHPSPTGRHNLLTLIKSNLATPQLSLPFHIKEGKLEWLPLPQTPNAHQPPSPGVTTPGSMLPSPHNPQLPNNDSNLTTPDPYEFHDRQTAIDFLQDALKDGPKPAAPLLREARTIAISERTLRRAKVILGIQSQKIGHREWHWALPG